MKTRRAALGGAAFLGPLLAANLACAQDPPDEEAVLPPPPIPTIADAIAAGKLIFETRARLENVDQRGIANEANAATLRTRLGWETGEWRGLRGLLEFEDVRRLGPIHYNVAIPGPGGASLNGMTTYPIVNDPEVTELNRFQVSWTTNPTVQVTLGRQRILLDDQRFVGNVGWRQDEQTFDAAKVDFAAGNLRATYAYINQVNRILGELRDWKSDSHLVNATWTLSEAARLQAFHYALDFSNGAASSSATTGARASGKLWVGLFQLAYGATYANQRDYGTNPAIFDLDYAAADLAGAFDIWTLRLGYERLEGNGTRGFFTPLGTTHLFNGWSDAFATAGGNKTHVDGIEDLNIQLTVQPRWRFTYWSNTQFIARYHDFNAERTGADLASEWDLQMQAAITPKLTFLVKHADYDREEAVPAGTTLAPPDRRKTWVSLEYRY